MRKKKTTTKSFFQPRCRCHLQLLIILWRKIMYTNSYVMLEQKPRILTGVLFIQGKRIWFQLGHFWITHHSLHWVWKCYQRSTEQTTVSNHCQAGWTQKLRSEQQGNAFSPRETLSAALHCLSCPFLWPGRPARRGWNLDFQLTSCWGPETWGLIRASHEGWVALKHLSACC